MGNDKIRELLEHRIAVAKVSADNEDYLIQFTIKEAKDVLTLLAEPDSQEPSKIENHKEWPFQLHIRAKTKEEYYIKLRAFIPDDLFELTKTRESQEPAADNLLPMPNEWIGQIYNACSDPCDMLYGPCACGAWHKFDEWIIKRKTLTKDGWIEQKSQESCKTCGGSGKVLPVGVLSCSPAFMDDCPDCQEPAAETVKYKELFESENLENEEKAAYFYLRTLELCNSLEEAEREIKRLEILWHDLECELQDERIKGE